MATITLTWPSPYPSAITTASFTRDDTGGTVSLGSWSTTGSGVWTAAFTAPASGLTYTFAGTATISGAASPLGFSFTDAASGYTGRYTSSAKLKQRFKSINVATYSTSDGSSTPDETSIQQAIQWAEDEIDARMNNSSYAIPLTATGSNLPNNIAEWANCLAVWWLYTIRGFQSDDTLGGDFKQLADNAYADMANYAGGIRDLRGVVYRSGALGNAVTVVQTFNNPISDGANLVPTWQSQYAGVRYIAGAGFSVQVG